ncbi:hypothetical protein [uncultured Tateyamaria sp.]|uniref:hypothetical protein n=1 Tax=uncultured Tateyamaria sp. TaxID=455651 RepID=UPI002618D83B|nr:hypothetical protein [uncultured Tateyamaria sp.]
MRQIRQAMLLSVVSMSAACSGLQPANVSGVDRAIGTKLPGAQGLTITDQDRIDDTVARGCAAGIYSTELCDLHSAASASRRSESSESGSFPGGDA